MKLASENLTIQLPSGSKNASVAFYDYIGRLALKAFNAQMDGEIELMKSLLAD